MTEDAEHKAIVELHELMEHGGEIRKRMVFPEADWKECLNSNGEAVVTVEAEDEEGFDE